MDSKILKTIEEEEKERARDDAKRALLLFEGNDERSLKELMNAIYGIERDDNYTSFVNSGNVKKISLISKPIVAIFPFNTERDFIRYYQTTPKEMQRLVKEGIVFPLAQPVSRYAKLDYAHQIIKLKPKDYFIRSQYFYSILFDECIELETRKGLFLSRSIASLFDKAYGNKKLMNAVLDEFENTREYYDRGKFRSKAEKIRRIKENIAYRYASVAIFIGEDATDFILESLKTNESLDLLLDLHIIFDHFLTQGLLRDMHDESQFYLRDSFKKVKKIGGWMTNLFNSYSQKLAENISITLIAKPTVDEIIKAHDARLFFELPSIKSDQVTLEQIKDLKAELEMKASEINRGIEKIDAKKKKVNELITITSFILSGILSKVSLTAGVASLVGGLILPRSIIDVVHEGMKKNKRGKMIRETLKCIHTFWYNLRSNNGQK